MNRIKMLLTLLTVASVSMGAISGRVTDTSGTVAISGAVVQLEQGGQTDTTDENGNFTIPFGSTGIDKKTVQTTVHNLTATIQGGLLHVSVVKQSAVSITAFNLSGKALSTVLQTVVAGTHTFSLPYSGTGVYLYRVKAGGNEVVLKGSSINGLSQREIAATTFSSVETGLAKQAKASAAINDVIAVTKSGYLNYREVVMNKDTSGIAIKMIVCVDTVSDVDGNLYHAVRIGNQVWTVENLLVTKYNDGTAIPIDTSLATWKSTATPKYCYPSNTANADSIRKFGALYNWYVVDPSNPKKVAPAGWHVPSDSEWKIMYNYLINNGYNWDGSTSSNKIAKSLATKTDWAACSVAGTIGNNLTSNNRSGFSALGCGYRFDIGNFGSIGNYGHWWSTTAYEESNVRFCSICCQGAGFSFASGPAKSFGFSVRLVKD